MFECNHGSEFLGLIVIGWDKTSNEPLAALTDEPWDQLTDEQEREVLRFLGSVALDFAPLAMPETAEELLGED
jgi:hypothetical protein